jgi:hypothetical protein
LPKSARIETALHFDPPAARLFLETNRKLENAVHLYEAVGFTPVPEEKLQASPYARSDLAMELFLV